MSEQGIIKQLQLALSKAGARVFRNNLGAARTPDGRMIRYGLCNPGGSDLIGWKSITIQPHHIGRKLALFVAIEVKYGKTPVTEQQANFIHQVRLAGGAGVIARTVEDALVVFGEFE